MNWINAITASRILLAPLLVISAITLNKEAFIIIFALGGLTDTLDGFLARMLKRKTEFGSALDTMADVLFFPLGLLSAVFVPEIREHIHIIAGIIALVAITVVTCAIRKKLSIHHAWIAKAASASVYFFVLHALIFAYNPYFFLIVIALCLMAALEKLNRCIK